MQEGKEVAQELMDAVLPHAERLLIKYGEFFPYGAAMTPEGEIVGVAAYDGDEHPESLEVIRMLQEVFINAAKSEEYKATALVSDVQIRLENGDFTDAINIALDHRSGYSVIITLPYSLEGSHIQYESISARAGDGNIYR